MTTTSAAPPTALQTPLYESYATIRSRGLCRSRSIRASEIEAEAKSIANDEDCDDDVVVNNENREYNNDNNTPNKHKARRTQIALPSRAERKRTLSLRSNFSQNSSCSSGTCHTPHHHHHQQLKQPREYQQQLQQQQQPGDTLESLYVSAYQPRARAVRTPTIGDYEALYASTNSCTTFRPLSDASSSSSGAGSSMAGCRDSVAGSTGSNVDYQSVKKNSRFSLDSLQSSATPKTPDYATTEEENIFLYTAPESPRRRHIDTKSAVVNGNASGDRGCYTPPIAAARNSFEMHELSNRRLSQSVHSDTRSLSSSSPTKARHSDAAALSSATPYQRTQSLVESAARPHTLLMTTSYNSYHSSDTEGPTYGPRLRRSPTAAPPPAPVRRESLYQKPKIYETPVAAQSTSPSRSPSALSQASSQPTRVACYQLTLPALTQRSSSAELLERSYTSQSLATIDQDEILMVPSAMPVLQNPVDRRYHTLGHMRVQSLGASLHMTRDSPLSSMLNMMAGTYYESGPGSLQHQQHQHHRFYQQLQPNRSVGNLYTSSEAAAAELERLAPEYVDPLDFKIGCQTTLRSKPIIPWYELAIRRDFKRQSCPPLNGLTVAGEGGASEGAGGGGGGDSASLSSNRSRGNQAHVVAAFEQSLSNMTSRLQQLTATAERKDGELTDMRQTIELLRKQSIQAGLTTAHMQSMGVQTQSQNQNDILGKGQGPPLPPGLTGHMSRLAQQQQQHQLQQQQQQQQQLQQHQSNAMGTNGTNAANSTMQRHHSSDSMCSLNSISSGCSAQDKAKKKKGWLRSSFTKAFSRNAKISKTSRHAGGGHHGNGHSSIGHAENGGSLHNHNGSAKMNGHTHAEPIGLSALATQPAALPATPTKNSPAKTATSVTLIENAKPIDAIDHDHEHQMVEDLKKQLREKDLVLTDIRLEALSSASQLESLKETVNKMRAEMMSLKQNNERLQKMVTSRSLAGSEVSLPGGVGHPISPSSSMGGGESRRYSLADGNTRPPMELPKRLAEEVEEENIPPAPAPEPPPPPLSPSTHIDLTPPPPAIEPVPAPTHMPSTTEELPDVTDGKKIAIVCYLGQPESFVKYCEEMLEADEFYANGSVLLKHHHAAAGASTSASTGTGTGADALAATMDERQSFPSANLNEFVIAYTYISGKTTWQNLDYIVRKTFKDYVSRIDPGTNLGLNTDSITSYHLGEAKRGPEMGFPELLPCGYIIGNVRTLYICLQGVGSLAFDSLIPRSIVHRYISLLTEHRRLILCGPSGTGKSYLARRLAEFLVARSGRGNPSEAIATFNVDHKSSKELRQYLGHIAEQAAIANGASELPSVIILDNLHHASALGDVFSSLLSSGPAAKLPCIIGTMSQATCNTTNLQLHHNFRWVLTANHMEPVKGFLGRFLRRRLFQLELQTQHPHSELSTVLAWLPTVWQHINRFLEIHSSSDVTIGPRLFLSCPLDLKNSQVWFTDIWNYHLSPYLVEAVREGVQLYGRRGGAWNDPSAFIRNSYPWPYGPDSVPPLRQINAEDVGLEGITSTNGENQDPLLNMLMRLQEAANYSENQEQESDCASLDSNITPDSSAGAE